MSRKRISITLTEKGFKLLIMLANKFEIGNRSHFVEKMIAEYANKKGYKV